MGKSQEAPQLAVGGMASRGLGVAAPIMAFSLESSQDESGGGNKLAK